VKDPMTRDMLRLVVLLFLLPPTTGCSAGEQSGSTLSGEDAPRTNSTEVNDRKIEKPLRVIPTIPWKGDYAGSCTSAGSGRPAAGEGSPARTRIVRVTTLDDYCYRTEEPIEGSLRWAIEEVP